MSALLETDVLKQPPKRASIKMILKALQVIETLTSEDLLMEDKERLCEIYKAAHSVNKSICYDVHGDWRVEMEKSFEDFKNMGLI